MKFRIGNSENRSLRIEFDWKNHKLRTVLEVLRIGFVVTSLIFFVLAAFGCKDKVEAIEISDPVDITIEPNEPKCKGHGVTAIYCPECHDIFDEPNGSEYSLNIWESNEIQKVSLDFIPTWPDYIELEKDLIINQMPYDSKYPSNGWVIEKGTKIYFKED